MTQTREKSISLAGIKDEVRRALDEGAPPLATFDADGTLWHADIGEMVFEGGYDAGLIDESTLLGPVAQWGRSHGHDFGTSGEEIFRKLVSVACEEGLSDGTKPGVSDAFLTELYGLEAWIFAGRSDEEMAEYGAQLYRNSLASKVYVEQVELLAWLRGEGLRVCVLSGSMRGALLGATRALGFDDADVFGTDPHRDDHGRYLPSANTLFGAEKGVQVKALHAEGSVLALGDSPGGNDRALLDLARVKVAVWPQGKHAEVSVSEGLWQFLPRIPEV